ncbi:exodeoxyribonuclease III [archaeon]|jgi:exodeoxyribonuclease III|nr:exodeoxyribonuclease III [archaeon]MBT3451221.1 exodeoxyribonuclease III [archaeon]MBT6868672.1 exodeoxyribonuclease III [archaeon]MBT7193460.1 exodeoxyribonuclease III [archaeon]MBT7381051.1 exodeoxyribonuclease III [archaeon]
MTKLNIISWNVNGIRAVLKKGFLDFVTKYDPDIICIQETKAHPGQVDKMLDDYEHHYWNSAEKKGYSGTAIFSKIRPLNTKYGIGIEDLDKEGRMITLEFNKFFLVNVYTPNSKRGLARLEYRHKTWDPEFLKFVKQLEKNKPVIICGDLNVAHQEIDLKNPQTNKTTKSKPGNAGFTDQERERFDKILEAGFIDTFRYLHPEEMKYTWWSYMFHARTKNIGWRIDYFCISKILKNNLKEAIILNEVLGSDHCPVGLEIEV